MRAMNKISGRDTNSIRFMELVELVVLVHGLGDAAAAAVVALVVGVGVHGQVNSISSSSRYFSRELSRVLPFNRCRMKQSE
jgi:hypothetical protein